MLLKDHPLFSEYNQDKNHYDLDTLAAGSSKDAWWVCKNGHEWSARISSRTKSGNGCGYCSGRLPIPGETDIPTVAGWMVPLFKDKEKAYRYKPNSNQKEIFVCSKGHERLQTISSVFKGSGCKICSGQEPTENNNFSIKNPEKSKYLKNFSEGYTVTPKSDKTLDFVCPLGHEFSKPVSSVVKAKSILGVCDYCSNKKILVGFNDLWTTHPDVALKLLDQTDGYRYSKGVKDKLNFLCGRGHVYQSSVYHATGKNPTGCPQCYDFSSVSLPEIDLMYYLRHYSPVSQYKGCKISRVDIQATIEGRNVGIEYDGAYHHYSDDAFERDKLKTSKMLDHFDLVVRVRAYDLKYPLREITKKQNYLEVSTKDKTLEECVLEIIEWVSSHDIIDKE